MNKNKSRFLTILLLVVFITSIVYAKEIIVKDNVAPTSEFSVKLKRNIDLIIVTDYSSEKITEMNTKITEMKTKLSASKINVREHFLGVDAITKKPKNITLFNQTSNVQVYDYTRYFKYFYTKTGREVLNGRNRDIRYNAFPCVERVPYETVRITEGEKLPAFKFSTGYTFNKIESGYPIYTSNYTCIQDKYEVFDPNNKKESRKTFDIRPQYNDESGVSIYFSYSETKKQLDSEWSISKVSSESQNHEYKAVDLSDLNNIDNLGQSDKYVLFISDADNTKAYKNWGNYYPFGSLKSDTIGNYISNNNCNVYSVLPNNMLNVKVADQNQSIQNLMSKCNGEEISFKKGQFNNAIDHIISKYPGNTPNKKIDLQISTDYSNDSNVTTLLENLKDKLANSSVDLQYNVYDKKDYIDKINLSNVKLEGINGRTAFASGERLVLNPSGKLFYYKELSVSPSSVSIPYSLIYTQYPGLQQQVEAYRTANQYTEYDEDSGTPYKVKPTEQAVFQDMCIPPVVLAENVRDVECVDVGGSPFIFFLKNDNTLWVSGYVDEKANIWGGVTGKLQTVRVNNGNDIKKIIKGTNVLYAIKNDGTLWGIGEYPYVTSAPASRPLIQLFANATLYRVFNEDVIDVATGNNFALALTKSGDVYGWGDNTYGKLGINSGQQSSTISKINIAGISSIAAKNNTAYLIDENGLVYICGYVGVEYVRNLGSSIVPEFTKIKYVNKEDCVFSDKDYNWYPPNDTNVSNYMEYTYYSMSPLVMVNENGIEPLRNMKIKKDNDNFTITDSNEKVYVDTFYRNNRITDYKSVLINSLRGDIYDDYTIMNKDGTIEGTNLIINTNKFYNTSNYQKNGDSLRYWFNLTPRDVSNVINYKSTLDVYNLNLTSVQDMQLRNDSDRYFLYLSDSQGKPIENRDNYFSLSKMDDSFMNYLKSNNINSNVATKYENIIEPNIEKLLNINGNGIYGSIFSFEQYLLNKYSSKFSTEVQYIIADEDEVEYITKNEDYEKDKIIKESWRYDHNPSFYENSNGLAVFANKDLDKGIEKFHNVGEYTIKYKIQDNPLSHVENTQYKKWSNESSALLYVHRRPIADFYVNINSSKLNVLSTSYDLDHLSETPEKGIVEKRWKWKDDGSWKYGIPLTIDINKTYTVSLEVKDKEGAWSKPRIKSIDKNTAIINNPPVAMFTLQKFKMMANEINEITDSSYDPDNDPIAERTWKLLDLNNVLIANFGNQKPNLSTLKTGKYKLELMVRDNPVVPPTMWSSPYRVEFEVIDNLKLTATLNPLIAKRGQKITITATTDGFAKDLTFYFPYEITSLDLKTVFPIYKNIKIEDHHVDSIDYVLPMETPYTLDKNGTRLRQPYLITVVTSKDGQTKGVDLQLDVTGNIFDGIKTQMK